MTTPASATPPATDTLGGGTMGTTWQVRAALPRTRDLQGWHAGVQARLDAVVAQMSHWTADSDLSRFNVAAAGTTHVLPDDFAQVLACACDVADASGDAFDPTLAQLVEAWGFGPRGREGADTSQDALAAARDRAGWRRLAFDAARRTATQPGGLALDLSAIAKGFAADAVADWLGAAGVAGALVEVGGELRARGRRPDGAAWHVLVETAHDALDDGAPPCVLALDGHGVATSGDRWHRHVDADTVVAHTIDPRTGRPLAHAPAAVTVVAATAMEADAWSTALGVLGIDDGLALARERGLAARFVLHAEPATGTGSGSDVPLRPEADPRPVDALARRQAQALMSAQPDASRLRILTTPAFDALQVDA